MPVLQKKSNIWHYAPEKMRCIEKYLHFKISSAIITKRLGPKRALYSDIINGTSPSTYKLSSWSRLRLNTTASGLHSTANMATKGKACPS